jgi:hypothetical protein
VAITRWTMIARSSISPSKGCNSSPEWRSGSANRDHSD